MFHIEKMLHQDYKILCLQVKVSAVTYTPYYESIHIPETAICDAVILALDKDSVKATDSD